MRKIRSAVLASSEESGNRLNQWVMLMSYDLKKTWLTVRGFFLLSITFTATAPFKVNISPNAISCPSEPSFIHLSELRVLQLLRSAVFVVLVDIPGSYTCVLATKASSTHAERSQQRNQLWDVCTGSTKAHK